MNRKSLVIAFVLLSAILLVSPLIGTVAAHNTERHNDKFQTYEVKATYSFVNVILADHKYYPSAENVKKLVINWDQTLLTCEIKVGEMTYTLGRDFTFTSSKAVIVFYDPVFDPTTDPTKLYPISYRSFSYRVDYKYDFSAVPGGLDGTIRMRATGKDDVTSVRSLAGTGDFRNVEIKATKISAGDTFDPVTFVVGYVHEGCVSGWPCVVPASDTYHEVTYDELTALCLTAGLRRNPYPAPPVPTVVGPDANGMLYVYSGSEYYVGTITIGEEVYQIVACTTFDMTLNVVTGDGQMVYQAPHYFGDLGKMHNGFVGVCTVDLYGYGTAGYYFTATWVLQGFGRFNHQSLVLTQDSSISEVATGYCVVRMDRCK
jgi:hypothetical protein